MACPPADIVATAVTVSPTISIWRSGTSPSIPEIVPM
jgi:hypothetical protein